MSASATLPESVELSVMAPVRTLPFGICATV